MKRTKLPHTPQMTRGMTRGRPKMVRTKFPVKNCLVVIPYVRDMYFVDVNHFTKNPTYLSKWVAIQVHAQLKKRFCGKFIVTMTINNMTRTLIKE